jgi:hypothetical protein
MQVINILADGTEIDDISKIEISEKNTVYTVCQGIENARTDNKVLQEAWEE